LAERGRKKEEKPERKEVFMKKRVFLTVFGLVWLPIAAFAGEGTLAEKEEGAFQIRIRPYIETIGDITPEAARFRGDLSETSGVEILRAGVEIPLGRGDTKPGAGVRFVVHASSDEFIRHGDAGGVPVFVGIGIGYKF
jgi:hypothetical protein